MRMGFSSRDWKALRGAGPEQCGQVDSIIRGQDRAHSGQRGVGGVPETCMSQVRHELGVDVGAAGGHATRVTPRMVDTVRVGPSVVRPYLEMRRGQGER